MTFVKKLRQKSCNLRRSTTTDWEVSNYSPNDKLLSLTKLKAIADDKLLVYVIVTK